MARRAIPTIRFSNSFGVEQVSGNRVAGVPQQSGASASASIHRPRQKPSPNSDRNQLAKAWQIEAYRQVNLCGEARYAAVQYAAMGGRAEIGVSQPQTLNRRPVWINEGPEVEALAEIAPTVRDRSKLTRDFLLHRVIAGECYLIARTRQKTDPGYISPPEDFETWEDAEKAYAADIDLFADEPFETNDDGGLDPNVPIWEIVGVTELRKTGDNAWSVRHDNEQWISLSKTDPIIRMWDRDPENRREAWSPFRSMLTTLKEIEWLTAHIFTQVKSRLMSAGVWFLPENLTFPAPPPDAVEGGEATIAAMNEAEKFMVSLAASGMKMMDADDVAFPTIVMSDAAALAAIDQDKLIKFWSEIDDKAMTLRSSAIRRFALGMDMNPEKVLGSSGIAVDGAGGSAGSVNHWGIWANEEQTISNSIEPALDDFTGVLTVGFLRLACPDTALIIGYNGASIRMKQDRAEEAIQLYDRGLLKGDVTVREVGFDPENDMMNDAERKIWLLTKIAGSQGTPDQLQEALRLLGIVLDLPLQADQAPAEIAPGTPDRNSPGNLDGIEHQGPPREDHDHNPAPFSATLAACEVLVLRALEKSGNRLLNDGKRGRDRDRITPPHMAHLKADLNRTVIADEFDFTLAPTVLGSLPAAKLAAATRQMSGFCADLYNEGTPYTREGLTLALTGV